MLRRPFVVPFVVAAALVAVSACTSGSSKSKGYVGDISFGVLAPLSGPNTARGQDLVDGAQFAIDDINTRGGVIGLRASLTATDDSCTADGGRAGAEQLREVANMAGAVGGICDEAAASAARVFSAESLPFLVSSANAPDIVSPDATPTAYLFVGTPYQEGLATVHWLAWQNRQRLAAVSDGSKESDFLVDTVISMSAPVPEALSKQTADPASDMSSVARTAVATDPDVVYWAGSATGATRLITALRAAGFTGMFVASAQAESPDFLAAGKDADGAFVITPASPQNLPAAADWAKRFEAKFKRAPGRDAMQAYDAVRALAQAVTQTGKVDPEMNSDQLTRLDVPYTTFLGELRFAPDHTPKEDSHIVLKVEHGAFTLETTLRSDG